MRVGVESLVIVLGGGPAVTKIHKNLYNVTSNMLMARGFSGPRRVKICYRCLTPKKIRDSDYVIVNPLAIAIENHSQEGG